MTVLELSTIDLNERSRIACSALCGSFYQPGLAGAGRSEEQKASHGSARNADAQRECLVNAHHLPYRIVLADDLASQAGFEFLSLESCLCGVQKLWMGRLRLLHFHFAARNGLRPAEQITENRRLTAVSPVAEFLLKQPIKNRSVSWMSIDI